MDDQAAVLAPLMRQKLHPRHGAVVAKAVGLPVEIMDGSLVASFEAQVQRTPDRLAVQSTCGTLSYAELNAAANHLARRILAQALPPLSTVLVVLENSSDGLAAIYAVLKSGHRCAFLSPDLPTARLGKLLTSAQAACIITRRDYHAQLAAVIPAGLPMLLVEETSKDMPSANPGVPIAPDQPAMVRFTSGSTGEPKCIVRTHRQLLYGVWQYVNDYAYSPADRHALTESLGASTGSRITFCPLVSGGSIHIFDAHLSDVQALCHWAEMHAITVLYLPTVTLRALLQTLDGDASLPDARMVHVGGQTVYRRDAEQFVQRFSDGAVLVCRYAMSEIGSLTHFLVDCVTRLDADTVPAGYALPGREILILDDEGRDQGFDQPGEIAVRHLLASEEETFDDGLTTAVGGAGDRAPFRTADLGLLRPDGCLIHLGRKDDMVKVRGNRVALAEAERILLSVAGVAQAAIKPFPTPSGDNRLVGYVMLAPGAQLMAASIRQELGKLAPSYMIPARFVVLPALPLTTSGKVDRQALPLPGQVRPDLNTPFVAPRSELEQQIADIWAELLELDAVGVDDSFFELGGDSIMAMRMALTTEQTTGGHVSPEFFRIPTVAHLARLMSGETATEAASRQLATLRSSGSIVRHARRFTPRNLARYLVQTGPLWHNRALPYGLGVRMQRALVAQPWFQQRFYARQLEIVRRWQVELGAPQDEQALTISLLANTWLEWRNLALTKPGALERWVTMGSESWRLFEQRDPPCGIVIVLPHVGRMIAPLQQMIQLHGRETAKVTNDLAINTRDKAAWAVRQTQSRTAQLWQAQQVLRRNGVVFIAGDGLQGDRSVDVPFWGRQRPFQIGAAELSIETGALFIPAFVTFDATGRVQVEVTVPLTAQAGSKEEQMIELTKQYGALYAARWPQFYTSVRWHLSTYHSNLPVV